MWVRFPTKTRKVKNDSDDLILIFSGKKMEKCSEGKGHRQKALQNQEGGIP